ncbi:two-component system response regulator [Pseudoalteromonas rubra]|uniref:Two-component system response regulator n=1 Tax=Pseudoalteromonas rubra TaxID=43658 RepID=A0A5S3WTY9_9GAMM|nr:response regulator [Pseudoalteromonas rubra]TMP28050.1 two-component system response regulator [Pseudoalteromonas rubra]TMP32714.1 two-component system response regulator [Pseudoalteromonas rubra]
MSIVIIEDEPAIADTLVHILEMDGFDVQWFTTAGDGLTYLQQQTADLVILDVGLPDGNGFDLCKQLRQFSTVPIIFLTARGDEIDRVVGLEIGADDYVTKPFSPREMLARVKLRLRKPQPAAATTPVQSVKKWEAKNFDYYYQGMALGLTALEFKVVHALITHSPNVLSRAQLLDATQAPADCGYERNIDSHIKAIRIKMKQLGCSESLKTKRGFGYYFEEFV